MCAENKELSEGIKITQVSKPVSGVKISTYHIRFDYLDHDILLPYLDNTSLEDIYAELERLYEQCK